MRSVGENQGMRTWPVRALTVAALLAFSAGAQVAAGAGDVLTVWQATWLVGTALAAGGAGLLAAPAAPLKKSSFRAARLYY
jgi:hypothetical protein